MSDLSFLVEQHTQEVPGKRISFDIETLRGEESELQAEMSLAFEKSEDELQELFEQAIQAETLIDEYLQKTAKPLKKDTAEWEKIVEKADKAEKSLAEKKVEWLEKAALKNSARVLCACFVEGKRVKAFTWMPGTEGDRQTLLSANIDLYASESEEAMLKSIVDYLDMTEPIAMLAGHNSYGFDLPKLRQRMARYGIDKPYCLYPGTDTKSLDTMHEYCKYYAMGRDIFASLREVANTFQLDSSKVGSGSEVEQLYNAGEYVTIIAYCAFDAILVSQIVERMEGKEC